MNLPEFSNLKKVGNKGIQIVKSIIENEHNWLFRKIEQEDDYGLDGYIDLLEQGKYITGKTIGIQVKTGKSYFEKPSSFGWTFYGESKHLNYYLNSEIPIILALVDDETKDVFWNVIDINTIIKTKKGWKLSIPKSNMLSNMADLKEIANKYIDYTEQIENLSNIHKAILESDICCIAIDRHEIENKIYNGFEKLQMWLTSSEKMIINNREKLFIFIFGYDDDPRELYQIEEVRDWMKVVFEKFKYWGYFLNMDKSTQEYSSINILMHCCINFTSVSKTDDGIYCEIEYDLDEADEFRNLLFNWLNEFCAKYSISEQIIFDLSMKIFQILDGLPDEEVEKLKIKNGYL